jgi:hypothetical protein
VPKRTNEFQQLIHFIYQRLAPPGATVTESAMVQERASTIRREVDVLIECVVNDLPVRVAIECRDRERPGYIEWIDQLIGKYRDLDVDQVVAVSRSGVTPAAEEKGRANRIQVRTLGQAMDGDWPAEFIEALGGLSLLINSSATSSSVIRLGQMRSLLLE